MEPAHVPGRIVERDKIVDRSIDASGSQTIGNRPQAQDRERGTEGKPEESQAGQSYADSGNFFRCLLFWSASRLAKLEIMVPAEMIMEIIPAQETEGSQFPVHTGPGRAQKGVRKSQTDKCQINDNKQ